MASLMAVKLGETVVEAFCPTRPGRRWHLGRLVGRSHEKSPHYDVMLEDRTILANLSEDMVRLPSIED